MQYSREAEGGKCKAVTHGVFALRSGARGGQGRAKPTSVETNEHWEKRDCTKPWRLREAKRQPTRAPERDGTVPFSCAIARKEARESHYWLRLLTATSIVKQEEVSSLIQECHELIAILTTIIKNTQRNRDVR